MLTIYQVLLHQGPILKFTLSVPGVESCPEIKHLISFLARNDIQDFTLCISSGRCLRLPKIFFACLQLRNLHLRYCLFDPPPTFEGFDNLISVEFQNIAFTRNISFICKCPLLERLTLKGCTNNGNLDIDAPKLKFLYIHGSWNTICFRKIPLLASVTVRGELKYTETPGIIGVFRSLPVTESLSVEYHFWQILAAGNVPDRLPANPKYLKTLELPALRFEFLSEISCALCLIRSSPNLQKLRLADFYTERGTADDVKTVDKFLESQDFSDISLNKLREVDMRINDGLKPEMEFVKLLLVKSPVLETMHIRQCDGGFYDGYRILKEVTRFRRASSTAEIIYLGADEKP